MVDRADLQRINELYTELNRLVQAHRMLSGSNSAITSMVISQLSEPDPDQPDQPQYWARSTSVNTENMEYPPQMVNALLQQMEQREHTIADELKAIGITGVEPEPRMATARRR
jgi:hypothetical protein